MDAHMLAVPGKALGFIDVLRDVGKHFSVNVMLQKDSVRERLETREQGISYTEFSYVILQAYDFLHLRRQMNCTVQLAGSDQYGNIVAGIDLIRREFGSEAGEAYGVTAPLVTRSDGRKMSKSSGEALWLSADTRDRTTPYPFYQYWINLPDTDVVQWMKWYTLLSREEIDEIARPPRIRVDPMKYLFADTLADTARSRSSGLFSGYSVSMTYASRSPSIARFSSFSISNNAICRISAFSS